MARAERPAYKSTFHIDFTSNKKIESELTLNGTSQTGMVHYASHDDSALSRSGLASISSKKRVTSGVVSNDFLRSVLQRTLSANKIIPPHQRCSRAVPALRMYNLMHKDQDESQQDKRSYVAYLVCTVSSADETPTRHFHRSTCGVTNFRSTRAHRTRRLCSHCK